MTTQNWQKTLIGPGRSIRDAITSIEAAALRILVVVDEEQRLLGTVTDGDIRRGVLRQIDMTESVSVIMNRAPISATEFEADEEIRDKLNVHGLLHIPIVDSQKTVVGLRTIQDFFKRSEKQNAVVLMAGGFGKRLRPLTEATPKPLLNVGDRPLLETILFQFIDAGFRNFFFSTHYKSDQIVNFFGNGEKWRVSIRYLEEKKPLGTAGVLSLLPVDLPDSPVLVMNGDVLSSVNFDSLLQYHSTLGSDCTIAVKQYQREVPYGVVDEQEGRVRGIVEKPIETHSINAGIYAIENSVIRRSGNPEFLDMPSFINDLIVSDHRVFAFPLHEYWLDIGRKADYEKANIDIKKLKT